VPGTVEAQGSSPEGAEDGLEGAPGWVDSHSHLQEVYLSGERGPGAAGGEGRGDAEDDGRPEAHADGALLSATLARAAHAGVERVVCVGTGPGTTAAALELADESAAGKLTPASPALWATGGLHPHDAAQGTAAVLELLEGAIAAGASTADGGRLVAVGECGLDYHYDHSPRDVQRRAFAEQVAFANRHGLALVIHARDAWDDLFDVLGVEGVPERTVLHCFTGGPTEARRCLDSGMFVSFSGIITFKNAGDIREAVAVVPLDRMLVETDSPFLAPVPHRGQVNEPANVALVGRAVAAVKGTAPSEVARATSSAASAVFEL
jgi:TatD DNase family protein